MVSTPEIFTENSQMTPAPSMTARKPRAGKPLPIFTEVLDVKNKTDVRQVGTAKSKRNKIRSGSML